MSLTTPQTVRNLQAALHAKAKGSPSFRFYSLYDKLHRADILSHAYAVCKANRGAAGVDGETFSDIKAYGTERWLGELAKALQDKTYRPQAVRRVWIPKPNGKQRPLGIPTIRDRVAQMAAVLVLGAIFEADLQPEQYAYRPGRSALDAVQQVHRLVNQGHTEVVDGDLSGYFDTIPHAELMTSVARRISDGAVLGLIKQWLTAPVEETDDRGRRHRTTRNKDEGRGVPQGAPLSPLLSNLYMRRFILGWKVLGHARRLKAQIVNYADDFVICCRGTASEASRAMRSMMEADTFADSRPAAYFNRVLPIMATPGSAELYTMSGQKRPEELSKEPTLLWKSTGQNSKTACLNSRPRTSRPSRPHTAARLSTGLHLTATVNMVTCCCASIPLSPCGKARSNMQQIRRTGLCSRTLTGASRKAPV